MNYNPDAWELDRCIKLVAKDRKQRWLYREGRTWHISEEPIPYRDKISVRWVPLVGAVAYTFSPALLPHAAV